MILVKFLKRGASLETASAADLADVEFRTPNGEYDLSPSVYEIEDTAPLFTRALAEHGANAGLDPPGCRSGGGFDLVGALPRPPDVAAEPGYFAFIREAHREADLQDRNELLAVLAAIVDERTARTRRSSRDEVRAYVRARLSESDPEWTAFCGGASKGGRWRDWAKPP